MTEQRRKRSKRAALVLMVPASSLLMTACAPHVQDVGVYSTAQECQQANPDQAQQCDTDFQEAAALHPQVAPKYVTREECEQDFGAANCEPAPERHANGSFFMPFMMGYMSSRLLGTPFVGQQAPGAGSTIPPLQDRNPPTGAAGAGSVATQPLYKSRDDQRTFRTANNYPVATASGLARVIPGDVRPRVGSVTRSGGFGSTAARMSTGTSG